jgi:hypothetical protein
LWSEYLHGKQTYSQLAEKHACSSKTIQRHIDCVKVEAIGHKPREVIVLMDTSYWGRRMGVMLFKDALTGQNLYKMFVRYETNALYIHGVDELRKMGFEVLGIVCDGRKGLLTSFPNVPVQMCQFHQVAIIRRYLTRKPKLQAGKELMEVVILMKQTDKESFMGALAMWFEKWRYFLDERTINPETGKSFYTHKKLRSAYRSLARNSPWLFTWYDNYELDMPNTTNAIDGHFADLKNKLRNHNGLSVKRKMKFIAEFLKA